MTYDLLVDAGTSDENRYSRAQCFYRGDAEPFMLCGGNEQVSARDERRQLIQWKLAENLKSVLQSQAVGLLLKGLAGAVLVWPGNDQLELVKLRSDGGDELNDLVE